MRKLRYQLVDVFTERAFGGNPLAVFPDARDLDAVMMQAIAKELNLSETAFVLPPENRRNDYRVRIFTPTVELPMAGHPTIGTAFVLMLEQMTGSKRGIHLEEGSGVIPVTIQWHGEAPAEITMNQLPPVFGARFSDVSAIAEMLSLDTRAILATELPVETVSTGVPFLLVPVKRLAEVRAIRFRREVWEGILRDFEAPHVYAFTLETELTGSSVHSRMFAPALGISEDPATGAAAGPLGCYLARHRVLPATVNGAMEFINEQGIEMGRPSLIKVGIEQQAGSISNVRISGQCRLMGEGFLYID